MSLSKQIDYGSAHPPIPRQQVPSMSEWLKRHTQDKPRSLWRR